MIAAAAYVPASETAGTLLSPTCTRPRLLPLLTPSEAQGLV